jgi:hypothetical protein
MQEESRKKIEKVIASNKFAIKKKEPKIAFATNLRLRHDILVQDKREIAILLSALQSQHSELSPFVHRLKSYVKDITEETHICAVYLILCHIFENWDSVFLLADNGKSNAVGNLIRTIKEGIMLTELFCFDCKNNDSTNLKRWFSGYIIEHSVGREKMSKNFDESLINPQLDFKKMDAHIYQMESQVPHNSYATILELVSPFTEDYDFDGFTGYHRTLAWLRYATGSLAATNISLKAVYSYIINDEQIYNNLDKILLKYNPNLKDGLDKQIFDDFQKK